jgi:hypothetical protein
MSRSRQREPVYVVYDEATFLKAPDGDAAVVAPPPIVGRARLLRWTRVLTVALAGATGAQVTASLVDHDPVDDSRPGVRWAQATSSRAARRHDRAHRPPRSTAPMPRSTRAPHAARARHHRQARRARASANAIAVAVAWATPTRTRSLPVQRPAPASTRWQAAPTDAPGSGTRAVREFGFEG